MFSERAFFERLEREAHARGRAEGHAAGVRETRRLAAQADPANFERARQHAWAEKWVAAGRAIEDFSPPAQGWPEGIKDVDLFAEQFVDDHVLKDYGHAPAPTAAPTGSLTEQLIALLKEQP